jgi:hypothetical protein
MGFTGRGIAMRGVAKIALFDLLLSQKTPPRSTCISN